MMTASMASDAKKILRALEVDSACGDRRRCSARVAEIVDGNDLRTCSGLEYVGLARAGAIDASIRRREGTGRRLNAGQPFFEQLLAALEVPARQDTGIVQPVKAFVHDERR